MDDSIPDDEVFNLEPVPLNEVISICSRELVLFTKSKFKFWYKKMNFCPIMVISFFQIMARWKILVVISCGLSY